MKTPDETKRRFAEAIEEPFFLAGCVDHDLIEARGKAPASMADTLAYIRQLEADNAQQARCIENMTDKLNAAHDEVTMLQAQAPEWISVEERLPEKGERVLVTNGPKGGFVCESYLNVNGKWMRAGCELVFMTPHYWMPMPGPLKEAT